MNTPNRPHEELDADERELARIVRALPGGEPPPGLDLRILKAAQDAVSAPTDKRRRRALWATSSTGSFWAFGTAAAAVLAVGISWQMFMQAPTSNLPASGPAAIAKDEARDRDSTTVEFVPASPIADQGRAVDQPIASAAAPPPPPMESQRIAPPAVRPLQEERQAMAESAPMPFPDEHVAEMKASGGRQADQSAKTEQYADDLRTDAAARDSDGPANEPAATKPADASVASATRSLDRVEVTGSRIKENANAAPAAAAAPSAAKPAAPPPVAAERGEQTTMQAQSAMAKTADSAGVLAGAAAPASQPEGQAKQADKESWVSARQRVRADARLYPESWILKIRSRLRRGDVIGARASLKLFVERYPQETVPSNLKPLLDE